MSLYQQWEKFGKAPEYFEFTPPYATTCVPDILAYYKEKNPEAEFPLTFAIDVACGNGQFAEVLAEHCSRVLAFDVSEPQIDVGRRKSTHANVTYRVESVFNMSGLLTGDLDRKADLMVSAIASHYFNTAEFYNEVRKCLRFGGLLAEVIFTFGGILGLPVEVVSELRSFMQRTIADNETNEEYNRIYEISRSKYQKLNVLLEEVKWCPCQPVIVSWRPDQLANFILTCRPKKNTVDDLVHDYCKDIWKTHANGEEKMTVQFNGFVVFSRNLQH